VFRVLQALWFVLPVLLAGLVHVAVIKLSWFPQLARYYLDAGLTWRGRRVLGDNKTVRGLIVMVGTTVLVTAVLSHAFVSVHQRLAVAQLQVTHPSIWGLLLGAGYILGELPNSLLKRQLNIPPGEMPSDRRKALFWTIDQLDSVGGVFLVLLPVWRPDLVFVSIVVAIALLLHPSVAALMVALGLKDRIG